MKRGYYLIILIILNVSFAFATVSLIGNYNYSLNEEDLYYFNFSSKAIYNPVEDNISFYSIQEVPTENKLIKHNNVRLDKENVSWIYMNNISGNLSINPFYDNQTGLLTLPLAVTGSQNGSAITMSENYNFFINATNDAPVWINSTSSVDFPLENGTKMFYINITDEENNFPINFSINWSGSCYHAPWTGLGETENCSLFIIETLNNNTGKVNFTPTNNLVGEYNATINITEGGSHPCPFSPYCDENYSKNISIIYNITVNVLTQLFVNTTNCSNSVFYEGGESNCTIIIRTRGRTDLLNLSSVISFANLSSGLRVPNNRSWFIPNNTQVSSFNNEYFYNISIIPEKFQIGNWSVNLNVKDITSTEPEDISNFYIYVNRNSSLNSIPNVSINSSNLLDKKETIAAEIQNIFSFDVRDDDFLIEDKWSGYNETIDLNLTFEKDGSVIPVSFWSYNIQYPNPVGPVYQRNLTKINVSFSPTSEDTGNYTIYANFSDKQGDFDMLEFNLTIINDTAPNWASSKYNFSWMINSTKETTTNNLSSIDLNDSGVFYAKDIDLNDNLHFSLVGNVPTHINLSEEGILNFFPWKEDVGNWNFIIKACDDYGKCTDSQWNFEINNTNSPPIMKKIAPGFIITNSSFPGGGVNYFVNQSDTINITVRIYDEDLAVVQKSFVNENLTLNRDIINLTNSTKILDFNFSVLEEGTNYTDFLASFYANYTNLGNYTINVNVSDYVNAQDNFTFNLTILKRNEDPILINITNISVSILDDNFTYDFNAIDIEDSEEDGDFIYSIEIPTGMENPKTPPLNNFLNSTTGILNFNFSNMNYSGIWNYEIKVQDRDNGHGVEPFVLFVYGYPNVTSPIPNEIFNLQEGNFSEINFTLDYAVNNSNLTYELYMNKIFIEENGSIFYFLENFSLRDIKNISMDNITKIINISIPVDYSDESYFGNGNETKLKLLVYNPEYEDIVSEFNWTTNITHVNQNISFSGQVGLVPIFSNIKTLFQLNLSEYFSDYDYFDNYYKQDVNFSIISGLLTGGANKYISLNDYNIDEDWIVNFNFENTGVYNVSIIGNEWDNFSRLNDSTRVKDKGYYKNDGSLMSTAQSNYFIITILDPTEVPKPSKGGSGGTSRSQLAQHYGLKIITPEDILISEEKFVELNFSVMNTGNVDLFGINLSGIIELNSMFTSDLTLQLSENWIDSLKVNEIKNYSLRVDVDTGAIGKYLITIFGNVTNPKFSDWGEFYIEVLAMDESEIAQLLVFTEKLISENPECLELTEFVKEAKGFFDSGDLVKSQKLVAKIIEACEESISSNEQHRYNIKNINPIIWYILIGVCLGIVIVSIVYLNNRIKFKKYNDEEYL